MSRNDPAHRKEVRLFPCHHIRSEREAELRATAALLATIRAVSEFGRNIVAMAGGPKGKIRCYTEVCFKDQTGAKPREDRLDGILQATYGKKSWRAILEVKVGNNLLDQEQFDRYHTLAKHEGMNAFITISNQPAMANGLPPGVKPKLKAVRVKHLSWERLLSEAQHLSRQKAIADPDQQWILEEWIRYLTDSNSRIIEQPHMGQHWIEVLRYAREANLGACKSQLQDVVEHWDAFLKKTALRLHAKLGADVVVKTSKAEHKDPAVWAKNLLDTAISDGRLRGTFRVPDAAGDLSVVVLLAPRCVQYSIKIKAPTEGKAKRRIRWLLKQLQSHEVPNDLVVQVDWGYHLLSQAKIAELRDETSILMQGVPANASPRSFCLQWTKHLLKCKGRSTVPVLRGIAQGLEEFYGRVVEGIKPFVPKVPQLQDDQPEKEDASDVRSEEQGESAAQQPAIAHDLVERRPLPSEASLDGRSPNGAGESLPLTTDQES